MLPASGDDAKMSASEPDAAVEYRAERHTLISPLMRDADSRRASLFICDRDGRFMIMYYAH